ncbi:PREDICTED: stress enhanced protein 2, chloroplastic [Tarenaya hassleriana]|uniref:stress enhanced protein 2, chloroplastic n=1 Tax=Tarenaya hassleriana TaxID=28532 RepID=UPI00053C1FC6|nr:PREDICTED: stress enhanced protein 2, chloroplastic [Tarenaya hassleriana]
MATVARLIRCQLPRSRSVVPRSQSSEPIQQLQVQRSRSGDLVENGNIVLQPRLCTLRSYGSDRGPVIVARRDGSGDGGAAVEEASPFFETLSEYIESSKKSQDFEIITGRIAMIVFAATVTEEIVTGNSVFKKLDVEGLSEAIGACLGAMGCAAIFAWLTIARNRVGGIFTVSCNSFIDSLIDQIVDGLFYESELSDWADDV